MDNRTDLRILGYVGYFDNRYYAIRPKRIKTDNGSVLIGTRVDWTVLPYGPGSHPFPSDSPMRPVRWTRVPFTRPDRRPGAVRYF